LKNTLAYIEFAQPNPNDVWAALSSTAAEGFLAYNKTRCFALIRDNERAIFQLSRKQSVAEAYKVSRFDDLTNTNFEGLQRIEMRDQIIRSAHISFDGVTSNGRLFGWAYAANDAPVSMKITVDGELIELIKPNRFRDDLLKANIGMGCAGFSFRLPDRYLDGNDHETKLELYLSDDPSEKIVARMSKIAPFPFHFNLPRPWTGSGRSHAVSWPAKAEAEYLDIRHNILDGAFNTGLARAADFITRRPSSVFKDFGLKDRYLIEGLKFMGFREKITHRWGELFNDTFCELGPSCCKSFNLPYNAKPLKEHVVKNSESLLSWRKGDLLDKCPLKIRHFASKELTQKYAQKFDIRTPELYGIIKSIEEFDAFNFPKRYVLKPDFGSGIELYLMHDDLNLFDGFRYGDERIRARLAHYFRTNPNSYFIVEEFLDQDMADKDQPIVPLDYKLHCFGGKARFVYVSDKNTASRDPRHRRQSWLSRDWAHTPFSFRTAMDHPNIPIKKPFQFDLMCGIADQICTDLGKYIRVDMYATAAGPVLGEISSFSSSGIVYTPYADIMLGQCWEIFDAA